MGQWLLIVIGRRCDGSVGLDMVWVWHESRWQGVQIYNGRALRRVGGTCSPFRRFSGVILVHSSSVERRRIG
jgi:hypothetical protein